jgi:L-cysteine:1D-myo-inositol 2-amino-2-deoxy-alpha-D-glucopyranoside ligase
MSKSLGNLVFVSELVKESDPMAVRLALLDHSHRAPWEWNEGVLTAATERLDRWRQAAEPGPVDDAARAEVRAALDDDLDLPRALEAVDDAVAAGRGVDEAADLLGVRLSPGPEGPLDG